MSLIKINIQALSDATWDSGENYGYALGNKADIWRIQVSSNLSMLESLLRIMPQSEINIASRFYHTSDKNRFIIRRGALRTILANYLAIEPQDIEFGIGDNKKPYLKNSDNKNLHYNISHSGDWILLAISDQAIGADTEQIIKDYHFQDVLPDNFSEAETSFINQTKSVERFFTLWTRKEALTKATGKGLDDDLKYIPSLDGPHFANKKTIASDDDWLVNTFPLSDNYLASVACSKKVNDLRFLQFNFIK